MSTEYNFENVYQGTTIRHRFFFEEPDGSEPFNMTGWRVRMQIKRAIDGALLVDCKDYFGAIDGDGIVLLEIPPSATSKLTPTVDEKEQGNPFIAAVYDLDLISPSDKVYTPFYGTIPIRRQITK